MNNISGIILSYNNGSIIAGALSSLSKICNEIILFDTFSTDNTLVIAKEFNCKIHSHALDNFRNQKNRAIKECTNDWVFILDADEIINTELINNVSSLIKKTSVDCWGIARKNYIEDKGIFHFPDYQMRLFRKSIQYGGHPIHHNIMLNANNTEFAPISQFIIHTKTIKMQDDSYRMYSTLCPEDFMPGNAIGTKPRNEEETIRWEKLNIYNDYILKNQKHI